MKRTLGVAAVLATAGLGSFLFSRPETAREATAPPAPPTEPAPAPLHGAATAPERAVILAAAPATPPAPPAQAEDLDPALADESRRTDAERAQLARWPLLSAIRGEHASPQARYDAMRGALERSGPTQEAWSRQASEVFDAWRAALGESDAATSPDTLRCFVAGCQIDVTFASSASYERARSAFRSMGEDGAPHGGRVQTPGLPSADGTVHVTWMMLRPDLAPPPLTDAP